MLYPWLGTMSPQTDRRQRNEHEIKRVEHAEIVPRHLFKEPEPERSGEGYDSTYYSATLTVAVPQVPFPVASAQKTTASN